MISVRGRFDDCCGEAASQPFSRVGDCSVQVFGVPMLAGEDEDPKEDASLPTDVIASLVVEVVVVVVCRSFDDSRDSSSSN